MYISSRLELYGTKLKHHIIIFIHRNTGSGLASMSGRFGGILYPYILYLSKLDIGPISKRKSAFIRVMNILLKFMSFKGFPFRQRCCQKWLELNNLYHVFIKIN